MLKIKRNKIITFCVLFIISSIVFIPWLMVHYTIDDYTISNVGYDVYSKKWSLIGGRPLMYVILQIARILHMGINTFIILNTLIAIFISTISVMLIVEKINKYKKSKNIYQQLFVYIISYITIYNFMFIDCMYFVECSVMSISILLYIIAAYILVESNGRKQILMPMLLTISAINCYQGTICMLFAICILLITLKEDKSSKDKLIILFECCAISILSILLNYVFVLKISNILNENQGRINSFNAIPDNIKFIINNTLEILLGTCGLFPRYLFFTILISQLLIIISTKDRRIIMDYIYIILISIISTSIFFVMTKSSFECGRMRTSIGAIIGITYIYMYIKIGILEKKVLKYLSSMILAIYTIITIYCYELIMIEQRKVNKLEKLESLEIEKYIKNYEIENHINVKYIVEIYKPYKYNQCYYKQIKTTIPSINASGLRHYGIPNCTLKFYTNLKLQDKKYNLEYNLELDEKGYKCIEDTLYIEVYKA